MQEEVWDTTGTRHMAPGTYCRKEVIPQLIKTETKKEDDKFIYIYNDDVKLSLLFFDNLIKYYNCVKISVEDCWKLDNFTISNSIIIVSFYDNELQGTHYNNLKKFIKEQSISNKFIVVFDDMSLDVYDENGKSFHEILLDFKILK